MIPRWLPPVLVVIFVLVTAWASYNLSSQLSASRSPSSSAPILTYEGSGSYFYVATLAPNDLYNSTTVSGTNVTLFAPITRWVNVTFVDGVTLDSAAASQLVDHFTVTLSTPVWSKTLDQRVQENTSTNATSLAIVDRFSLNVSWVQNLTQTIDSQLGYSPSQFTVTLAPAVTGYIAVGNKQSTLSIDPQLDLTFGASLITPTGLPATFSGGISSPGGGPDPNHGRAVTYAYLFLAASLGALAVSIGVFWTTRRGTKSPTLPELESLIEPYEEVIVRTAKMPEVSTILSVKRWQDLVKVADTIGRPILQPPEEFDEPKGLFFYVLDGSVAYRYWYPSNGIHREESLVSTMGPSERSQTPGEGLNVSFSSGTDAAELTPAPAVISSAATLDSMRLAAEQLKADLGRIHRAPLSPASRARAIELVRTTAQQIRSTRASEIQHILEEFHRTLEDYLGQAPPSP